MQKSRRGRGLQLLLLPVTAWGCSGAATSSPPAADPAPAQVSAKSTEPVVASPAAAAAPAPAPPSPEPAPAPAPAPAPEPVAAALPTGTRVLQVGDSFAAALGSELGKLLKQAGVRTSVESKTPSYIGEWAFGKVLPQAISDYNPDLVLVTLGANEVEVPQPEQRVGAIQRLVKTIGARPCVWILPPLWKADTGLMQVIKDNAKPCQVLDSSVLVPSLPRARDHIHPSSEGRVIWATAVFDWLKQQRDPQGPRPWSLRGGPS